MLRMTAVGQYVTLSHWNLATPNTSMNRDWHLYSCDQMSEQYQSKGFLPKKRKYNRLESGGYLWVTDQYLSLHSVNVHISTKDLAQFPKRKTDCRSLHIALTFRGCLTAMLPKCLSDFRMIGRLLAQIPRLWMFPRTKPTCFIAIHNHFKCVIWWALSTTQLAL